MSKIFTDEELTKIENLLGKDYIALYTKLWNERIGVKRYFTQVQANLSVAEGYHKTYWEYKVEEIKSVLRNQSRWLKLVLLQLKGKISEEEYQRLEDYLKENEPDIDLSNDSKAKMCIRCGVREDTIGGWCAECNEIEAQERKAKRTEGKP